MPSVAWTDREGLQFNDRSLADSPEPVFGHVAYTADLAGDGFVVGGIHFDGSQATEANASTVGFAVSGREILFDEGAAEWDGGAATLPSPFAHIVVATDGFLWSEIPGGVYSYDLATGKSHWVGPGMIVHAAADRVAVWYCDRDLSCGWDVRAFDGRQLSEFVLAERPPRLRLDPSCRFYGLVENSDDSTAKIIDLDSGDTLSSVTFVSSNAVPLNFTTGGDYFGVLSGSEVLILSANGGYDSVHIGTETEVMDAVLHDNSSAAKCD